MEQLTNKRWTRVLLYLLALYIINFIDRNNISFAIIGGMERDLHMGTAVGGLAGGLFYLGYIVLQIPSGIIAEKYDANKVIMILSVAWGLTAAATGLVQDVSHLLVLRFLLGLIDGGVWTVILLVLSRWFPEKERATSNSIWLMCLPLSFIVMGPISGWLIQSFGWRSLFIIEALPAVLLGILFYVFSASRPEEAKWLPEAERNYILSGQAVKTKAAGVGYRQAILHPQVLIMSAVYCFWLIGAVGFFMWVPAIIKSMSNQGIVHTGFISTLPYIAALIGLLLIGRLSDRLRQRRLFVCISLASFGVFLLLSTLTSDNYMLSLGFLVCSGLFLFATHAPFWVIPVEMFSPELRGAAMGMISLIGNVGSFVGPYVVGYVRETTGSFTNGMLVLVASLWIASALTLLIKKQGVAITEQGMTVDGK